jgi:penicillin-binding protein 1A
MVSAYTTFANEGYYVKPVYIEKIVDQKGKILRQHQPETSVRRAIAYENAATMLGLMQQVVEEGSAGRLRSEFKLAMDIAGKTGTTQDHADGWFIGITPDLITGVWVGAENPAVRFRTLTLGQGSNTALPVWGEFMALLTRTPAFTAYRNSRFRPLPPELRARLACASYLDNSAQESFLDRIFNKIIRRREEKRKNKDQRENRDRLDWKFGKKERVEGKKKRKEQEKKQREQKKKQ